jgi:arylsulfatase A-like enzyme
MVLTDLVPTLLEAAGLDPAKTVGPLDGVSVLESREPPCWRDFRGRLEAGRAFRRRQR